MRSIEHIIKKINNIKNTKMMNDVRNFIQHFSNLIISKILQIRKFDLKRIKNVKWIQHFSNFAIAQFKRINFKGIKNTKWIKHFLNFVIAQYRKIDFKGIEDNNAYQSIEKLTRKLIDAGFTNQLYDRFKAFCLNVKGKHIHNLSMGILVVLLLTSVYASKLNFGYEVSVDGKVLGFSLTKKVIFETCDLVKLKLQSEFGEEFSFGNSIDVHFVVAHSALFNSPEYMQKALLCAFDQKEDAYGISLDGGVVASLKTEEDALAVIQEYKDKFGANNKDAIFDKEVAVLPVRVLAASIMIKEDAFRALSGTSASNLTHVVLEGENLGAIAIKYNTTIDNILMLNPRIKPETLQIGAKLNVSSVSPLLGVKTLENMKVREEIGFAIQKIEDPQNYVGSTNIVSAGKKGEKETQYQVVKVNGVQIARNPVKENVISQPKPQVVKVGTKKLPSKAPTGTFKRPYYGTVTSRFGSRWGRMHTGIDIGGHVGDAVTASDGGTVIFAGWEGGYGKYIKIRHSNGYETAYGHLSAIKVSVGQSVAKGQLIGLLGNTGVSTGPHLHFEVKKNGVFVNPTNYIR